MSMDFDLLEFHVMGLGNACIVKRAQIDYHCAHVHFNLSSLENIICFSGLRGSSKPHLVFKSQSNERKSKRNYMKSKCSCIETTWFPHTRFISIGIRPISLIHLMLASFHGLQLGCIHIQQVSCTSTSSHGI